MPWSYPEFGRRVRPPALSLMPEAGRQNPHENQAYFLSILSMVPAG